MIEIGKFNKLKILRFDEKGNAILDGGDEGELFLFNRELPFEHLNAGDEIDVFVYRNAKRNAMATTMEPYVMPGTCGFLQVNDVSKAGAILDWGLSRDLFLPSREMKTRMRPDRSYLVYVYYDENTRQIIASARVEKYIGLSVPEYKMNQEVKMLVVSKTEIGYKVIVDDAYWGIIYDSEIFTPVQVEDVLKGYVKQVREDGKIDLALQKQGFSVVDALGWRILDDLDDNGGYLPFSDKSDPEDIARRFGCSKKAFKKTIGALFSERLIYIERNGIRRVKTSKD